jgi:SSS family solute:Na+ symporter
MAVHVGLKPTFPLEVAGYTLPGYTALYTLILNLGLAVILTPLLNALGSRQLAVDETAAADYQA